jgi:4-amino-4-deoxychorismate lyase
MTDKFSHFTSLRYDERLLRLPQGDLKHAGWNFTNASPFFCLNLHRDRLLRAANHWKWDAAVKTLSGNEGLDRLAAVAIAALSADERSQAMRTRIMVDSDGRLSCQTSPAMDVPLENLFPALLPSPEKGSHSSNISVMPSRQREFAVVIDQVSTAQNEFTHFKTTRREAYDTARARAGIQMGDLKEVLLVNADNGFVMEGSLTTPYLWRRGRWVTPPVSRTFGSDRDDGGQDGTTRRWALERQDSSADFRCCFADNVSETSPWRERWTPSLSWMVKNAG